MKNLTEFWCNKHRAAEVLGLSQWTLRDWRLDGRLIENVHWVRISQTSILYNIDLLKDYIANISNPGQHQLAIEAFLKSLPSNANKTRGGRRAS